MRTTKAKIKNKSVWQTGKNAGKKLPDREALIKQINDSLGKLSEKPLYRVLMYVKEKVNDERFSEVPRKCPECGHKWTWDNGEFDDEDDNEEHWETCPECGYYPVEADE